MITEIAFRLLGNKDDPFRSVFVNYPTDIKDHPLLTDNQKELLEVQDIINPIPGCQTEMTYAHIRILCNGTSPNIACICRDQTPYTTYDLDSVRPHKPPRNIRSLSGVRPQTCVTSLSENRVTVLFDRINREKFIVYDIIHIDDIFKHISSKGMIVCAKSRHNQIAMFHSLPMDGVIFVN